MNSTDLTNLRFYTLMKRSPAARSCFFAKFVVDFTKYQPAAPVGSVLCRGGLEADVPRGGADGDGAFA